MVIHFSRNEHHDDTTHRRQNMQTAARSTWLSEYRILTSSNDNNKKVLFTHNAFTTIENYQTIYLVIMILYSSRLHTQKIKYFNCSKSCDTIKQCITGKLRCTCPLLLFFHEYTTVVKEAIKTILFSEKHRLEMLRLISTKTML